MEEKKKKKVEVSWGIEDEEERSPDPAELRCRSTTDPIKLSVAIVSKMKQCGYAKIRCIGPAALGRAIHAHTIARGKLTPVGIEAIAFGAFFEVRMKDSGDVRTGITITIEDR